MYTIEGRKENNKTKIVLKTAKCVRLKEEKETKPNENFVYNRKCTYE